MLVLSRRPQETVVINTTGGPQEIVVTVFASRKDGELKLGFEADRAAVSIVRGELLLRPEEEPAS